MFLMLNNQNHIVDTVTEPELRYSDHSVCYNSWEAVYCVDSNNQLRLLRHMSDENDMTTVYLMSFGGEIPEDIKTVDYIYDTENEQIVRSN